MYICPLDGFTSYTSWRDQDLLQSLLSLKHNLYDAEKVVTLLRSKVNYRGVICRWEHTTPRIGPYTCPYMHSYNPLAETECQFGTNCWRKAVCPMKHIEPKRNLVEIKAKSIAEKLVFNDAEKIKAILKVQNCNARVEYVDGDEIEEINWVYLGRNDEVFSFTDEEAKALETSFNRHLEGCRLKDGSEVVFLHMLQISKNGDFRAIARVPRLVTYRQFAKLELSCTSNQLLTLQTAITQMTITRLTPRLILSVDMLRIAKNCGLSVENGEIIGSKEAIEQAVNSFYEYKLAVFPLYRSLQLPAEVFLPALQSDFRLQTLLFHGNYVYGPADDINRLIALLPEFEYAADCPMDADEYSVAILCSELGISIVGGKIVGSKAKVMQALGQLDTETVMIPANTTEDDLVIALSLHPTVEVVGHTVKGQKEEVAKVIDYLSNAEIEQNFPINLPYQTVQTAVDRFHVRVNGVKIVGTRGNVGDALRFLTQEANAKQQQPKEGIFQYHVLPDWYANLDMDVYADTLTPDSEDYIFAEQLFMKTMQNQVVIVQILKIYNKKLYTNFAYKHESKSQVEQKRLEIMPLFHGTRATDPSIIYMSEEGLDSRLGGGMWGNGTYYAKNASYSHGYAFNTPNGHLQIFLCDVLVGDYVTLRPQAMVKPPPKKGKPNSFYHSVKGNTGGSDIWITYEVSMSYPKYLIEYRGR